MRSSSWYSTLAWPWLASMARPASTKRAERSTATIRPAGPTMSARSADAKPGPAPTSSTFEPGPMPARRQHSSTVGRQTRCCRPRRSSSSSCVPREVGALSRHRQAPSRKSRSSPALGLDSIHRKVGSIEPGPRRQRRRHVRIEVRDSRLELVAVATRFLRTPLHEVPETVSHVHAIPGGRQTDVMPFGPEAEPVAHRLADDRDPLRAPTSRRALPRRYRRRKSAGRR